jgi:hypothetical protein
MADLSSTEPGDRTLFLYPGHSMPCTWPRQPSGSPVDPTHAIAVDRSSRTPHALASPPRSDLTRRTSDPDDADRGGRDAARRVCRAGAREVAIA